MSNEMRSEQMDKLRGYLVETYRLLADAEKTLAVSSDLEERAALRQKISDYERYLQKWRRELEDLQFQQYGEEDSEDLLPENSSERAFGPAYFYEMARKAHSQALYPEALALTQIVREQDPYYPGLEAFEQRVRQASRGMPATSWEASNENEPSPTKGKFASGPLWIVLGSALLIIIVVAIVTLLLTADKSGGIGGKNGATTSRGAPPNVATGVIVFPPATDAPFLVATPTAPVQPSVPPELYGTVVIPPAPNPTNTPLPPTPTKKP